jgi:formate--tetrahydrofolate ligase
MATRVAEIAESGAAQFAPLYKDEMSLFEKIETIAKRIYRADEVLADQKIRTQLKDWEGGLWQPAGLHGQDAVQLYHRSHPRGAPDGHSCRCARCGCRRARASSWRSAARS